MVNACSTARIPGVGLRYRQLIGEVVLTLELQIHAAYLGIDALAISEAHALPSSHALPTLADASGYNQLLAERRTRRLARSIQAQCQMVAAVR